MRTQFSIDLLRCKGLFYSIHSLEWTWGSINCAITEPNAKLIVI